MRQLTQLTSESYRVLHTYPSIHFRLQFWGQTIAVAVVLLPQLCSFIVSLTGRAWQFSYIALSQVHAIEFTGQQLTAPTLVTQCSLVCALRGTCEHVADCEVVSKSECIGLQSVILPPQIFAGPQTRAIHVTTDSMMCVACVKGHGWAVQINEHWQLVSHWTGCSTCN